MGKYLDAYKEQFGDPLAPKEKPFLSDALSKRLRVRMLEGRWKKEKGRPFDEGERSIIENEGANLGPEDLRQHKDILTWLGANGDEIDKALTDTGQYKLEPSKPPENEVWKNLKEHPIQFLIQGSPLWRDIVHRGTGTLREGAIGGALDLSLLTAGKAAWKQFTEGGEEQQKRLDDTFESLGWQGKVPVLGRTSKIVGFFADPFNLPLGNMAGKLGKAIGLADAVSKTGIESKLVESVGNAFASKLGTREEQIAAAMGDKQVGAEIYDTIVSKNVERAAAEQLFSNEVSKAFTNKNFWDKLGKVPLIGENGAAAIARTVRSIPLIGEKFGVGRSGQSKVFRAAEGIKEFDQAGMPVYGAETRTGSGVMRRDPLETEKLWESMSPAEKQATRWWSVQRELDKTAFSVNSNIEGYIHHFWDENGVFGAIQKALRLKKATPASLLERGAVEAPEFVEHAERAILKGGGQARGGLIANELKEEVARLVGKPIPATGIPEGWVEIPKLQATRTGKPIGQLGGGRMAPARIWDEMIRHEEALKTHDGLAQVFRALGNHLKSNVLVSPGTTVTNAISGGFQYAGKVMESLGQALFSKSLSVSERAKPLLNDLWAPVEALYNAGKRSDVLWGKRSSLAADIAREGGLVQKAYGAALMPFEMVENFWKRALVNAELGKRGLRGLDEASIVANRQLVADLNRTVDKYAFNYANIPSGLQKMRDSPYGWMIAPFPTYGYKLARYYSRYGAALNPWIKMDLADRAARILTLGTLGTIGYMSSASEERKHVTGMTTQVDTTGRSLIGKTKAGAEQWLRTVKYPWLNLGHGLRGLVSLTEGGQEEGIMGAAGEFMSAGPLIEGFKVAFDIPNRWEANIPRGVRAANVVKGFIPGVRVTEGVTAMQGGPRILPETFTDAVLNDIPFTGMHGKVQIDRVTHQPVMQDANVEGMKFWLGLSMKEIDPQRYSLERQRKLKAALVAINNAKDESQLNDAVDKLKEVNEEKLDELAKQIKAKRLKLRGVDAAVINEIMAKEYTQVHENASRRIEEAIQKGMR